MKKKYLIKYKYKKSRMSFMFFADNELDALKQFIYEAERFKLPLNQHINLHISLDKSEYDEDLYD
mgnify:CR=1 FL=1